jgi:hypothetical protein
VSTIKKLARQENEILAQISLAHKKVREAEAKMAHFRKQRKLLLCRIKELGDREAQNIFKLEINEMLAEEPFLEPFSEIFFFLVFLRFSRVFLVEFPQRPFTVNEVSF